MYLGARIHPAPIIHPTIHPTSHPTKLKSIQTIATICAYNFVHTILFKPFCPYHFVHSILSNTVLAVYHFVRPYHLSHYHFVWSPRQLFTIQPSPLPDHPFVSPFLDPGHFASHVLQPSHIHHCTTS